MKRYRNELVGSYTCWFNGILDKWFWLVADWPWIVTCYQCIDDTFFNNSIEKVSKYWSLAISHFLGFLLLIRVVYFDKSNCIWNTVYPISRKLNWDASSRWWPHAEFGLMTIGETYPTLDHPINQKRPILSTPTPSPIFVSDKHYLSNL